MHAECDVDRIQTALNVVQFPDPTKMRCWPCTNSFEHCTILGSTESAAKSIRNRRSEQSTCRGFNLSAFYALVPLVSTDNNRSFQVAQQLRVLLRLQQSVALLSTSNILHTEGHIQWDYLTLQLPRRSGLFGPALTLLQYWTLFIRQFCVVFSLYTSVNQSAKGRWDLASAREIIPHSLYSVVRNYWSAYWSQRAIIWKWKCCQITRIPSATSSQKFVHLALVEDWHLMK